METKLEVGQRIDIFKTGIWEEDISYSGYQPNSFVAEKAGNKYHGNIYGRDMVSIKDYDIHLNTDKCDEGRMKLVGTIVIKSLK